MMLFFKKKRYPKSLSLDVAGTFKRQDALARSPKEKTEATLKPEPTNKHDPNAVKVLIGKNFIGYIPKTKSALVSDLIKEDRILGCYTEIWKDDPNDDGERLFVASVRIEINNE
jgi:hypothetical protein